MGPHRTPGQRAGLTRSAVLAAARELLAAGGLESLTMRALADRLHVAPNALYSHVAGKTALIDELLDHVLALVEAPPPDVEDPSEGLHRLMASTYDVLLAHADLVPLYLARQGARGPNAQRLGDVMIGLLARMGVRGPPAREALRVLVVYTIGFAAFATRAPIEPGPERPPEREAGPERPPEREAGPERPPEREAGPDPPLTAADLGPNFANGLGWLLEGIRQASRPTPS